MAELRPKSKKKSDSVPIELEMPFSVYNYKLIILGVALVVAGFIAMAVENKWDGFVSLYISPILIVAGFAELVYAIMAKDPKENKAAE